MLRLRRLQRLRALDRLRLLRRQRGRLDFLPAGRQGDAYALKVSSFNWQNFYDRLGGGAFFEAFKRQRARGIRLRPDRQPHRRQRHRRASARCRCPTRWWSASPTTTRASRARPAWRSGRAARREQLRAGDAIGRRSRRRGSAASIEDSPRPYRIFPVPMRVDAGESDRLALRQAFARAAFRPMLDHLGADLARLLEPGRGAAQRLLRLRGGAGGVQGQAERSEDGAVGVRADDAATSPIATSPTTA